MLRETVPFKRRTEKKKRSKSLNLAYATNGFFLLKSGTQMPFSNFNPYPLELLPPPVRLPGQNFFEAKFSPFQWTGRWKFATNGGSSQHFYRRLNASKSARIESREDSKTHSVAKIGGNGVFFVKRARCNPRLSH